MTRWWSNIIGRNICLWTHISLSKLVLNICYLTVLCWIGHYLSTLWTKLLANMQSIFNYWSSIRFLITDHSIWLSVWLSFAICISALSNILKFSLVTTSIIRMIDGSIRLLIWSIPFVLRSSHDIILIVVSYGLRLPFLCHLLSTRILNVSWWKLNGVLITRRAWISLGLHLSHHIWIDSCWSIFDILLSITILGILHWYDYRKIKIVGKRALTASIVSSWRQWSVYDIGTCLSSSIEILIGHSSIDPTCISRCLAVSLRRCNANL